MRNAIIIGFCMLTVPVAVMAASTTIDNLVFTTVDDSSASVKAASTDIAGPVDIPAHVTIDGKEYAVTTVEDRGFGSCENVTSVTLPETITTIGTRGFSHCGITSITLPYGLVSIGEEAFATKEGLGLTSITIPPSVSEIGLRAFFNTQLTSVDIQGDDSSPLLTIGEDAFGGTRNKLSSIRVARKEPPVLGEGVFRASDMSVPVVLYGPAAPELDLYKAADGWKDMNLVAEQPTGITDVIQDNDADVPAEVYRLNGSRVASSGYLTPGIYIVKRGSSTSKIAVN